jgi:ABC-type lipoprotein release transport system permease subunit
MDLQIAWRNIWRNPRRTAVILAAVIIGVWSMIFRGAMMRGILQGMIRNGIDTLTGHIQIHHKDYPSDPCVDHRIDDPAVVEKALAGVMPPGTHWSRRVRVNTVVSNARHNLGATLVGIDPLSESRISFIGTAVDQGRYLKDHDPNAILVGQALADRFDTGLGRKLILMTQAAGGEVASRAFRIRGIFRAEMESTEKEFVFITHQAARQMLALDRSVSEIAVRLPRHDLTESTAAAMAADLDGSGLVVRTWQQILPLLQTYLQMYDSFIMIWFVVVFVAMGFGILNTTLMAVFERMREFGLLKALGMRPGRIVKSILMEALFILMVGVFLGNLLGLASCWALSHTGIDLSALAQGVEYAGMSRVVFPVVHAKDVLGSNLVVLLLGLLVCLYPAVKAARISPVQAMTHT